MVQKEFIIAKPARDAAAKAKMEAEALTVEEFPLHADNEWNIRCATINPQELMQSFYRLYTAISKF